MGGGTKVIGDIDLKKYTVFIWILLSLSALFAQDNNNQKTTRTVEWFHNLPEIEGPFSISIDGNIYTFRIEDENKDFPITSYEWETSGIAIAGANESTFSFEAPRKKSYSVRCIFSNEYGETSLSATVSGGEDS